MVREHIFFITTKDSLMKLGIHLHLAVTYFSKFADFVNLILRGMGIFSRETTLSKLFLFGEDPFQKGNMQESKQEVTNNLFSVKSGRKFRQHIQTFNLYSSVDQDRYVCEL